MSLLSYITLYIDLAIFIYVLLYCFTITWLVVSSSKFLTKYKKEKSLTDYSLILDSPFSPSVSIIATGNLDSPKTIDRINSLLTLQYNDYEIILVNDGNSVEAIKLIIKKFELEQINVIENEKLKSIHIRGVYRSKNSSYKKLIFIDNEKGGTADSLNAGLNIASKDYFLTINIHWIIQPDAVLKLIKPILNSHDNNVIASISGIGVVESCIFQNGFIVEKKSPKNIWTCFLELEYSQTVFMTCGNFLNVLNIDSTLGIFHRELAIESGGYNINADSNPELMMKLQKKNYRNRFKKCISFIPETLCWANVSDEMMSFQDQLVQIQRKKILIFFKYIKIFFNPKSGRLGLLDFPFAVFMNWIKPLIELSIIVYTFILLITGSTNVLFYLYLCAFIYSFTILLSLWTLFHEEDFFRENKTNEELLKQIGLSLLKPLLYHPLKVYLTIKGNIFYFIGVKK